MTHTRTLLMLLALLLLPAGHAAAQTYNARDCIGCHTEPDGQSRLRISLTSFEASVHGPQIDCTQCHDTILDESHTQMTGTTVVDCGQCHSQENGHGLTAATERRPHCADCHLRHAIRSPGDPSASVHPQQLRQTCGRCHPAQSGQAEFAAQVISVRAAFHPKADFSGDFSMANCVGCHQGRAAHGESGTLSAGRCDRCHMAAEGRSALWGRMHPPARLSAHPGLFGLSIVYQAIAAVLLFTGIFTGIRLWCGSSWRKNDRDQRL